MAARIDHIEDFSADPSLDLLRHGLRDASDAAGGKRALAAADNDIADRFRAGESVVRLVRLRAAIVDELLCRLWRNRLGDAADEVALVAVGGYGRGELHPGSDVDLLILLPETLPANAEATLSDFMTSLWDLGFTIGHSVRTVADCVEAARHDLTVATTLIEVRLLDGPGELLSEMETAVGPDRIWPSSQFFEKKREEQVTRHHRYDDTGYNLEPNVKGSPGGLRDIQMINWVAKRHFGTRHLSELVDHGFLTEGQLDRLEQGRAHLWRIRFGLHLLTGRSEDRLLFDYQKSLAELLGYEDARFTLAVEQMMQRYYRTVMDLSRINEMLLQLFEEDILMNPEASPEPLNDRFEVKNGYLKTVDDRVFSREPSALLEVFLLLQQNPSIRGVSASTIGLIKRNLDLIDEGFRQDPRNHRLFLNILRAPAGVTHELRRMNLYGVLGLYIPAFGRIVGRMQYDLFHAYTVDEHTLFVVSNMRRFALERFNHEYPHCSRIMQSLDKPELAYLGCLFHDIAKGRGGDHSELGAVDARAFCLEHGLDDADASLVAWLVKQHLLLSTTAQKKDIGDPDVINEFADVVGDQRHLDYLYLLTVADVRGTNPNLWNSWKATLFHDLYESTSRVLKRGEEHPLVPDQLVHETREQARVMLWESSVADDAIDRVWSIFDDDYFLRHRPQEVAWHTGWLAASDLQAKTGLVDVRHQPNGEGVEAVLYTEHEKHTFAHTTAVLDELGMTIVDARIVPLSNGFSLDTFVFMELDERTDIDELRMRKIREALNHVLTAEDDDILRVTRGVSRQARMFSTRTTVDFDRHAQVGQTVMELITADRPGLLSVVGRVLIESRINIEAAKIMTIGERAEDVFYIRNEDGSLLNDEQQQALRHRLVTAIDDANQHKGNKA
ncbi:MAG: [protein-PII] uridylyltransferase [Pseudomonadota bacterium]